jgi:hypothetical protein
MAVNNVRRCQRPSFPLLTPRGIEEKAKITYRFLKRKMKEYKQMEEEIRQLKKEVIEIGIPSDAQD